MRSQRKTPTTKTKAKAQAVVERPLLVQGAGSREDFIRDYYAKAPGGSDEAWAMLGPGMQSIGRDGTSGSGAPSSPWPSVSASRAGRETVEVTLVYRTTDGGRARTQTGRAECHRDGSFRIESDVPAP